MLDANNHLPHLMTPLNPLLRFRELMPIEDGVSGAPDVPLVHLLRSLRQPILVLVQHHRPLKDRLFNKAIVHHSLSIAIGREERARTVPIMPFCCMKTSK